MINVDRKTMSIPTEERIIGHVGDNKVTNYVFKINETLSGDYSYVLYISFSDGSVNSILLDRLSGDGLYLWTVKSEHVFMSGIAYIQIKAIADSGEIWHSPKATVEFLDSLDSVPVGQYIPTLYEQLDSKINEVYSLSENLSTSITTIINGLLDNSDYITRTSAEQLVADSIDELLLPLNARLDGEIYEE